MESYQCSLCGYIYNPIVGDPNGGIDPKTPFTELPDNWVCPECGAPKEQFELVS
ncbi:MAG: rubredoxin [Campylobacterales bacterium]